MRIPPNVWTEMTLRIRNASITETSEMVKATSREKNAAPQTSEFSKTGD
jgi:hypothetical protein